MSHPTLSDSSRLPVEVVPARAEGALEPYLDEGELMLESPIVDELDLKYGANIAALLILDIDASRVLSQVEVLPEADAWATRDVELEPVAGKVRRGSLAVVNPERNLEFHDLDPSIWTTPNGKIVIEVEPFSQQTEWIRLSDRCYGLVNQGFLAGFVCDVGED
jgi:hypothetical protein